MLDKTKTAMGARLLRAYLEQPLIDKKQIEAAAGCSGRTEGQYDWKGRAARIPESDL
ncbi:MAG: hypothetical protein ACLUD0_10250 [Eubacterium ramulus]